MAEESSKRKYLAALPVLCCLIGIALVFSSLLPLGPAAARSNWTIEDSNKYQRVTEEFKISAYKSPGDLGLTEEEYAKRQQELLTAVEALREKLQNARQSGSVWKQRLWWSGLVTTFFGLVLHIYVQNRKA